MFHFSEADTRIFEYSRGEKDADGKFINIFADPADIRRRLDITLPNRNQMVDQYLIGEALVQKKLVDQTAWALDPDGYMAAVATKQYGYLALLTDPARAGEPDATIPNPESVAEYVKRNDIPTPDQYTPEESATIKMGAIAHQNLCIGLREVFELVEFDSKTGAGCTDYMVVAVMNAYQDWLSKKNGNTPAPPTSLPPSQEASTPPA